ILFIISCSELLRCAKQIRIDLASQALRELSREQHDDLERPMVQANALDKSGFVAREDCGAPDILTKSFAFPLEIRLQTIYRLIRKDQRRTYRPWSQRRRTQSLLPRRRAHSTLTL